MAEGTTKVNIAECIVTITPLDAAGGGPLQFAGDVAHHEAAYLDEPEPKYELVQRHVAASGTSDVLMTTRSTAGRRRMSLLMGPDSERLTSLAQKSFTSGAVLFDLDFFYRLFQVDVKLSRIQRHKRAAFVTIPTPIIAYDNVVMGVQIDYGALEIIDPTTGLPV